MRSPVATCGSRRPSATTLKGGPGMGRRTADRHHRDQPLGRPSSRGRREALARGARPGRRGRALRGLWLRPGPGADRSERVVAAEPPERERVPAAHQRHRGRARRRRLADHAARRDRAWRSLRRVRVHARNEPSGAPDDHDGPGVRSTALGARRPSHPPSPGSRLSAFRTSVRPCASAPSPPSFFRSLGSRSATRSCRPSRRPVRASRSLCQRTSRSRRQGFCRDGRA